MTRVKKSHDNESSCHLLSSLFIIRPGIKIERYKTFHFLRCLPPQKKKLNKKKGIDNTKGGSLAELWLYCVGAGRTRDCWRTGRKRKEKKKLLIFREGDEWCVARLILLSHRRSKAIRSGPLFQSLSLLIEQRQHTTKINDDEVEIDKSSISLSSNQRR